MLEQLANSKHATQFPHKFVRKVRVLQRQCGGRSTCILEGLLDCAETLDAVPEEAAGREAFAPAQAQLSRVLAQQLEETPLVDVLPLAPRLSTLLLSGALATATVLPSVLVVALAAADRVPDASGTGWRDVEVAVRDLAKLFEARAFGILEAEVAPHVARQIFGLVRSSGLPQLPAALRWTSTVLGAWPEAHRELTLALRAWVPGRLQQAATRWGQGSDPSPRSPGGRAALRTEWWLEALTAAARCGLLERSRLVQLCDELAPGLARAGVRTQSSSDELVVARQLAAELAEQPGGVRYAPESRCIYFRWPRAPGVVESSPFQEEVGEVSGRLPLMASGSASRAAAPRIHRSLRCSWSTPELVLHH